MEKILLVCAGGLSTGILVQKMKNYWQQQQDEAQIEAVSLAEYAQKAPDYDLILVGPQVSYRLASIAQETGKPAEAINPTDYALGDCEKIYRQAKHMLEKANQKKETE